MFRQPSHFTRRLGLLAALLLAIASAGGCKLWKWDMSDWNLEKYRDERATDIDHRLDKPLPVSKSPF